MSITIYCTSVAQNWTEDALSKKKTTIFLQLNFKTSSWFGLRSRATQDLKCPEQEQEYKKAQLKKKGYSQIFCTLPFTLVK